MNLTEDGFLRQVSLSTGARQCLRVSAVVWKTVVALHTHLLHHRVLMCILLGPSAVQTFAAAGAAAGGAAAGPAPGRGAAGGRPAGLRGRGGDGRGHAQRAGRVGRRARGAPRAGGRQGQVGGPLFKYSPPCSGQRHLLCIASCGVEGLCLASALHSRGFQWIETRACWACWVSARGPRSSFLLLEGSRGYTQQ
jgi:hypothetical protein